MGLSFSILPFSSPLRRSELPGRKLASLKRSLPPTVNRRADFCGVALLDNLPRRKFHLSRVPFPRVPTDLGRPLRGSLLANPPYFVSGRLYHLSFSLAPLRVFPRVLGWRTKGGERLESSPGINRCYPDLFGRKPWKTSLDSRRVPSMMSRQARLTLNEERNQISAGGRRLSNNKSD